MDLLDINNIAISGSGFIKLNNKFVYPHPEPQIINTLYGWSGTVANLDYVFLYFLL